MSRIQKSLWKNPAIFLKNVEEQAFLHDLYHSDLRRVTLIHDVELAWEYVQSIFAINMFPLRSSGSVVGIISVFQIVFQN